MDLAQCSNYSVVLDLNSFACTCITQYGFEAKDEIYLFFLSPEGHIRCNELHIFNVFKVVKNNIYRSTKL